MIVNVLCEGDNVIEKNKNRIRNIKINQQLGGKVIDKLYNKTSYEAFKNFLCNNVMFENISDSEVIRIYNCINKDQFKSWYKTRATRGVFDLITYYKIYK